ncbi:2Fe-2S ferredoxin [Verrucomicrobia bacterium LW23]|nr:2Fe-2S ferredoxin [Verrucomicrobia bacterium LW23]
MKTETASATLAGTSSGPRSTADETSRSGALPDSICVGAAADIPEGGRRIVAVGKISIGVFNVGGRWYALRNFCPHWGAELCRGRLTGTNAPAARTGEYNWGQVGTILRCPWHGWEFSLESGRAVFDERLKVRTYPVTLRDGELWIELRSKGGAQETE